MSLLRKLLRLFRKPTITVVGTHFPDGDVSYPASASWDLDDDEGEGWEDLGDGHRIKHVAGGEIETWPLNPVIQGMVSARMRERGYSKRKAD